MTGFADLQRLFAGAGAPQPAALRLFDGLKVAALLLGADGLVLYGNRHLLELLGETEASAAGADWFARFVPEAHREEWRAAFAMTLRTTGAVPQVDLSISGPGGTRLVSWDSVGLRNAGGEPLGVFAVGRDMTTARAVEDARGQATMYDPLTGLPNRNLFQDRLAHHFARGKRRSQYRFATLLINLDRFRTVNATLGRAAGDALLVQVGTRLSGCLRPGDSLARLDGDEFALIIDEVASGEAAVAVAARIHAAFKAAFVLDGREMVVTASIGSAVNKPRHAGPEDLLRDTEAAMHHAKARGQAGHEVFRTSMHARAMFLLELERELRAALEREALAVHYQPVVSLASGMIVGFEALARWERSPGVFIPPGDFIGIAEETGLINELGAWVLRVACAQAREWHEYRPAGGPLRMAVNLSPRQFAQPDLLQQISGIVTATAVPEGALRLEITESVLMLEPESAASLLASLHELHVHVCIDDFGTGYSSLSYLLRFPASTLKIDRSFVTGLTKGGQHTELVKTIIALAKNVGMDVVAEGVETAEQLAVLRALGCDYMQGFLVSKAVPAAAARALLEAGPLL